MLLVGLAAVVILAVVVAMALAFRRHRQTAELQEHFHAAYDEGARWKPLDDSEGPISSNE